MLISEKPLIFLVFSTLWRSDVVRIACMGMIKPFVCIIITHFHNYIEFYDTKHAVKYSTR